VLAQGGKSAAFRDTRWYENDILLASRSNCTEKEPDGTLRKQCFYIDKRRVSHYNT
jgi:hypothetical protein